MSKNTISSTARDRRKVLGLSLGSAIALLPATDAYACLSYSNNVTLFGSTDCMVWSGGNFQINNTGTLSSTSTPALTATGAAKTLTNSGLLSGTSVAGIENTSNSLTVINNGRIISDVVGLNNNGAIVSLTNNAGGTISGTNAGIKNNSNSSITSLNNNHIISGDIGINNAGYIGTLANTGTIAGTATGIQNSGNITNLSNSGSVSGATQGILVSNGAISSLKNTSDGHIEGETGIVFGGQLSSGTINVSTLTNAGQISGTDSAGMTINQNALIANLSNSGTITGAIAGIANAGSVFALTNSGTISSGAFAIYNIASGSLGPVTNSGLIAGTIVNLSSKAMTINGGSGETFGILTGASGGTGSAHIGAIKNTGASLSFASGNLLLNDNIDVGNNTVNNTGSTLQVNNSLSINGSYAQSAAATLLIGVGDSAVSDGVIADTGYGRLVVSGAATIESGSTVSLKSLNTYSFAAGQRYLVVSADKIGTNYNASSLNYLTAGFTGVTSGKVVDTGNTSNLVVTLSPKPRHYATTDNAISSLQGLQQYTGIAPGLLDLYNASLAIDSSQEGNKVGEQLSTVQNSSASHVASQATFDAVNIVGQRVDAVRLAQSQGMSGVAAGDDPADWSAWGQAFGGHARQGMVDGVSGYKANYAGLVLGVDRSVGESWRTGGALTYSNTSVHGRDNLYGSKTGVDSYGLIGYASYSGEPWYVNLSASVTQQRYDTSRNVEMTGYADRARGKFNGQQYVTKAEFGYPLAVAQTTTLTPLANLSYSYQTLDSYKESSGNGSALSVEGSHNNALRSGLGARLDKSFQTGFGDVVPYVQAIWTHQYNPQRNSTNASYIADTAGETSFTTFGASPVEDTADLSLGATIAQSDTLSLNARYNVQLGEQYQAQTITLQVRKLF